MSRKGNCHDNAVAESFFQLLKRERIRRHVHPTHPAARADVFDYIEMFYNPKRRHGSIGRVSPVVFEIALCAKRLLSVYRNLINSGQSAAICDPATTA